MASYDGLELAVYIARASWFSQGRPCRAAAAHRPAALCREAAAHLAAASRWAPSSRTEEEASPVA